MAAKGTLAINAAKYQKKKQKEKGKKNLFTFIGNRFSRRKLDELLLFPLELVRNTKHD